MLFLYDLLPAGLFTFALFFGAIGSLISVFMPTIPFIGAYQTLFKLVSVIALCVGLVAFGIGESEAKWAEKNKAAEAKITQLENKAPEINTVIKTEYVDRIKIVKEKGESIVVKVPYYVSAESDKRCPVPAGFVRLLNDAANTSISGTNPRVDGKTAGTQTHTGATGESK